MSDKKTALWLAIIFFLSFLIRFLLISLGPYHSDCLYLAIQAEKIIQTGQMQYLQSSGLPLTAVLGAFFVGFFKIISINDPVFAVNFMSVLFGSMSVVAMYFCVKQLTDTRTAAISSVLLSLNPFFIALSIFGNSHMLATFFLLVAVYYLLSLSESRKTSALVLSGIWLGVVAAVRLQDFAVMIIPIGYYLMNKLISFKLNKFSILKYLAIFFLPCLSVILLAYLPKFFFSALPITEKTFLGYLNSNFTDHLQNLSLIVLVNTFFGVLSIFSPVEVVLMAVGFIYFVVQKQWDKVLFLILWIVVPAIIFSCLSFFVFRLMIISFIALIILESYGLTNLSNSRKAGGWLSISVIIIFVFINLTKYYPMFLFRHQNALLPEFFQWVNTVTEENACIIERDHTSWIVYYANRIPFGPRYALNRMSPEDLDFFKKELDDMLQQDIPVYITKYGLLDKKDVFRKFMINNYRLEYVGGKMIEDWHLDCLKQVVVQNDLFKIKRQTE